MFLFKQDTWYWFKIHGTDLRASAKARELCADVWDHFSHWLFNSFSKTSSFLSHLLSDAPSKQDRVCPSRSLESLETEVSQNYGMWTEETSVGGQSWGEERGKMSKGPKVCEDVIMKPVTSYAGFKTNGPKGMGNRKQTAVTTTTTKN